jgi:aconitate hydratase
MMRGTFANVRLRNGLVPGVEGGYTKYMPNDHTRPQAGEIMSIFNAAVRYREDATPLVVLAGKEYGSGSSRDWAAKGPMLLGVRAVIAESYERIHRSNLIGMGILPLEYMPGQNAASLHLDGDERYTITGLAAGVQPRMMVQVVVEAGDGVSKTFEARVRIDTPDEAEYYRHGGILPYVLRNLRSRSTAAV